MNTVTNPFEEVEYIKTHLNSGYEREFFDACLKNLSAIDNRLRLSNFAYSLRELIREVLEDRAPDDRIKNCCWYQPFFNDKGKVVITRKQRMKYTIQGGLSDKTIGEEMVSMIEENTKAVVEQYDDLSKFTHITRDIFETDEDEIDVLAKKPLIALIKLLHTIESAKKQFSVQVIDKVSEELFNVFLYETIDEIDCLSTHHYIKFFHLGEANVTGINDSTICFNAKGSVYVHLQYGSDYDLRIDNGLETDIDCPFEAHFSAPIPDKLKEVQLKLDAFDVDTDGYYE